MPLAPAAKALIILSSVAVAAGVALYESENARADLAQLWHDVRTKASQAWNDFVRDLSEQVNMSPAERTSRAREIMRAAGRNVPLSPHETAARSSGTGVSPWMSRSEQMQSRSGLSDMARHNTGPGSGPGSGSGSGTAAMNATGIAASVQRENEANSALRRRNYTGPFLEDPQGHIGQETGVIRASEDFGIQNADELSHAMQRYINAHEAYEVSGGESDTDIGSTVTAPLLPPRPRPSVRTDTSKSPNNDNDDDDETASCSTAADYSHILTPTESEFSGVESEFETRSNTTHALRHNEPWTETSYPQADDVRSVSSMASDMHTPMGSNWSVVSEEEHPRTPR